MFFMKKLSSILHRLRSLGQRRTAKQEIDEELRFHIEQRTAENIAAGMTPEDAAREARKRFGNVQSVREECRETRGAGFGEATLQDIRFGLRMLRKNPGFTAVAVLTLALGIGANTAIFSLLNAILLRPLPLREPERLVWISNPIPGYGLPGLTRRSNLLDWRELTHSFESLGAYIGFADRISYTLTGRGEPKRLEGALVTGSFLATLGAAPGLGRGFLAEECQRNGPLAIILTDRFWRGQFQADAGIVGKYLTINNKSWTVVGVLPPSFDFSSTFIPGARSVDFLCPLRDVPGYENWGNMMAVVGRLKSGVTVAAAQAELDVLNAQLQKAHPERGMFGSQVMALRERIGGSFRRQFLVLAGAAATVLLIACANLSNLLLARAVARRKEMAVRVALGADRRRLIRQLLIESLLLSGLGALLGLPVAYLATNAFAQSQAFSIPLLQSARVDLPALSFTLLVAVAAALIFGMAPALQLSQATPEEGLRDAGRGTSSGRSRLRLRRGLIVSEVAMTCALLIAAGLLMRSFSRLLEVHLGFRPAQAAAWRIAPNRAFANHQEESAFYRELLDRVRALPGVESATLGATLPLELNDIVRVHLVGAPSPPANMPGIFLREVGGIDYFKTMGIPLRSGRDFGSHDAGSSPKAIVVNESLARTMWPGRDAVGQALVLEAPPDPPVDCRVIAVVGDVRQSALEQAAGPEMYMMDWGGRELIVRTSQALQATVPAVRAALREFNPGMATDEFKPLEQIIDRVTSPRRLVARLLALFSTLALLLAAVGIYGVLAGSVNQRTHEIGIRLALGSTRGAVMRLVLKEGMSLAFVGCFIGVLGALALNRAMQGLLFGVSPSDPLTIGLSALLLLGVATVACWLPARRAARVDPMVALRHE